MSLFGGIQPARLAEYLSGAATGGLGDDGLLQRLQVLVYPDPPEEYQSVDRAPDTDAQQRAERVFRSLAALSPEEPLLFRFNADAQALFDEWYEALQRKIRQPDMNPARVSHLAKYAKLMPALSLHFELADQLANGSITSFEVSLEHARQAAAWTTYLETHAYRVYSTLVRPEMKAAAELSMKIARGCLGAVFDRRDVYRKGWSGLDTADRVQSALDILRDRDWIRELPAEQSKSGRPPTTQYVVNPKVWKKSGNGN